MNNIESIETFTVTYRIYATTYEEAKKIAFSVQVEQTVEFPYDYLPNEWFKEAVVGQLISLERDNEKSFLAKIAYNDELTSFEVAQFLNVVFGNSSLQPNIWVEKIDLSERLWNTFKGPKFGIEGLREILDVPKRAMLQAVVKPLGSSVEELSDMCYQYASGGVDVIKDDHGLANQKYAPFEERIKYCVEAVNKGSLVSKKKTLFAANVVGDGSQTIERAYKAKELGASALMVHPGMVGFGTLHQLAKDENLNLPIISHPALSGGFIMPGLSGIDYTLWFGFLNRIFGADMSIFVSFGGRFTFTKEQCQKISKDLLASKYPVKKSCPAPGGGVTEKRLAELMKVYGPDVMYLIGGDMFRRGNDLKANSAHFIEILEAGSK